MPLSAPEITDDRYGITVLEFMPDDQQDSNSQEERRYRREREDAAFPREAMIELKQLGLNMERVLIQMEERNRRQEKIEALLEEMRKLHYGDGNGYVGIISRLRALEQAAITNAKYAYLIITPLAGLILKAIWDAVMKSH